MGPLVEIWAAENHITSVRSFSCKFVGMVLLNDDIKTKLPHADMVSGRRLSRSRPPIKKVKRRCLWERQKLVTRIYPHIYRAGKSRARYGDGSVRLLAYSHRGLGEG